MQGTVNAGLFCTSTMGTKANFSSINKKNMACPLKCDNSNPDDSQIQLMSCQSIFSRLDGKYIEEAKDTKYYDIYRDIHSQKAAVQYWSSLLEVRRIILEELQTSTVSTSGPSLDTAPPARQGSSGD